MSLDLLILLIVFIILPLIQRLLEAARQRDARTPERAARPPTQRAPTHAPLPPTLVIPPLPEMPTEVAPKAKTARRTPAQDAAIAAASGQKLHPSTRHSTAVVGLRNRLSLRHAIVLTVILGPCRAINPYDWPERAAPE